MQNYLLANSASPTTIHEAAQEIGCSRRTVYGWRSGGGCGRGETLLRIECFLRSKGYNLPVKSPHPEGSQLYVLERALGEKKILGVDTAARLEISYKYLIDLIFQGQIQSQVCKKGKMPPSPRLAVRITRLLHEYGIVLVEEALPVPDPELQQLIDRAIVLLPELKKVIRTIHRAKQGGCSPLVEWIISPPRKTGFAALAQFMNGAIEYRKSRK